MTYSKYTNLEAKEGPERVACDYPTHSKNAPYELSDKKDWNPKVWLWHAFSRGGGRFKMCNVILKIMSLSAQVV